MLIIIQVAAAATTLQCNLLCLCLNLFGCKCRTTVHVAMNVFYDCGKEMILLNKIALISENLIKKQSKMKATHTKCLNTRHKWQIIITATSIKSRKRNKQQQRIRERKGKKTNPGDTRMCRHFCFPLTISLSLLLSVSYALNRRVQLMKKCEHLW